MDYSKFYTPPEIAALLINQLNVPQPKSIIDICCGSYNLLHAAKIRWPQATLVGVDIISHTSPDIHCVQSDGRQYALDHTNTYPLILANPPFAFTEAKGLFPGLYDIAPTKYSTSRLEIEMLFANLKMLTETATLMIIMPNTFVSAKTHLRLRKHLAQHYHIQKIIELPDETFGAKKISSYALIIKRSPPNRKRTYRVTVSIKNNTYTTSTPSLIPQAKIKNGYWCGSPPSADSLNLFASKRGNVSSCDFQETGILTLHIAKNTRDWKPSIRFIDKNNIPSNAVYAETGDIVVSRIGKSAGQWYRYHGEKAIISDCLYRIKDPTGIIAQTLNGNSYSHIKRGVATKYITMDDFSQWYHSI